MESLQIRKIIETFWSKTGQSAVYGNMSRCFTVYVIGKNSHKQINLIKAVIFMPGRDGRCLKHVTQCVSETHPLNH